MAREQFKSFVEFREIRRSPSGKTGFWDIHSRANGSLIGRVFYKTQWRTYVFETTDKDCIFDSKCLAEIVGFLLEEKRILRENYSG